MFARVRPRLTAIHCQLFALLLAFSSQQAISGLILPTNGLVDQQLQTDIIDLSGRADAEALTGINQLLKAGDYDAAIAKANHVLKINPRSGLANEILGTAYFLNGQQDAAIPPLKKAIESEPGQSGPLTKLGIVNMESGKLVEAENLLLQAIQVDPKHRFAHQRLGLLYEFQKKDQLAIDHFRLGLEGTNNRYIGVAVNLGRLLNKSGSYPLVVAVLEPRVVLRDPLWEAHLILGTAYLAIGDYSKARVRFQRVLQLTQSTPEALLGLAKAQHGEGDLRDAMDTIVEFVEVQPDSALGKVEQGLIFLGLDSNNDANSAFERAVSLGVSQHYVNQRIAKFQLDREEFAQARDIYQSMVDIGTAEPFDYGQLSELLMQQGDIEKGEQVLIKGVKRFPGSAYLQMRHGSYLASIGQYKRALPVLKKATELAPDDATVWRYYAIGLSRANRNSEAARAAARLYELTPNRPESAIFYASRLEANKQPKEAKAIYRKVLNASPMHALALNNLAIILASENEYVEAEKMAVRAVEVLNDNGNLQDTLGWIYYQQGRLDEAVDKLDHASKLSPDVAVIWYHKGVALAETGQQTKSRFALEKALSFDLKADWVANAEALLEL